MISHVKAVWAKPRVSGGTLLVLLALADHANTDDTCYPSVARLMDMTMQSERGVQNALRTLKDSGIVSVKDGGGRNRTTLYRLHLETPQILTVEPAEECQETPQILPNTPQMPTNTPQMLTLDPATSAPKALLTTNQPLLEPLGRSDKADLPSWVPRKQWDGYVDSRKKIKHPMTEHAKELNIAKLEKLAKSGHDPKDVLELAVERGWRGLFAPKGDINGTTGQQLTKQQAIKQRNYATLKTTDAFLTGLSANGPLEGMDDRFLPEPGSGRGYPEVLDGRLD